MFKSNLTQLKHLNQSNTNRKLIKIIKVWIELDLIFYEPHKLDQILDLIFKTNPIQFKLNNII